MNLEASLLTVVATLVAAMIWVVKSMMNRSDRILESRDTQIARAMDELAKAIAAFGRVEQMEEEVHEAILKRMEALAEEHSGIIGRLEDLTVVQKQLVEMTDSVLAALAKATAK